MKGLHRRVITLSISALLGTLSSRALLWAAGNVETWAQASPYLFPLIGALGICILIRAFGPEIKGTGTDSYISGVRRGWIPFSPYISPLKILATVLTVGSGGSGGLLGPSILAGSRAPALLQRLRISGEDFRYCQIVGAAAALGGLLGAPIAAALLATEVLYRSSIEYRGLIPALVGGWAGHLFSQALWDNPSRAVLAPIPLSESTILIALLSAIAASLLGIGLVKCLRKTRQILDPRGESYLTPLVGAMATGFLAWGLGTEILGWGMPWALEAGILGGDLGPRALLLAPAKVLASALTVGSGGSGGVMGPALVTGALTGNAAWSILGGSLSASVIAAKAACLTSVSNVPLAASVLMIELFGPGASLYAVMGSLAGSYLARSVVAYESSMAEASDQKDTTALEN